MYWNQFWRSFLSFMLIILCLSVVQQNKRVTRWIVLALLTKALYEFGCFKEKVWLFLKFWIWQRCYFTLTRFCMNLIRWKSILFNKKKHMHYKREKFSRKWSYYNKNISLITHKENISTRCWHLHRKQIFRF